MTGPELALLGHLIGDGCTLPKHAIQYTTNELRLAIEVAELATTVFGDRVNPRVIPSSGPGGRSTCLRAAGSDGEGEAPLAEWLDGMGAFGLTEL